MFIYPRNWTKFQHYKDRNPPWIKVHRCLLNDPDFMSLPLDSIGLAMLLWLLASESEDGKIDAASRALAFRLHRASTEIESALSTLIQNGFFADASKVLATCLQHAIPEGEREGENRDREQRQRTETEAEKTLVGLSPDDSASDQKTSDDATEKKPAKKRSRKAMAKPNGDATDQIISETIAYLNKTANKRYTNVDANAKFIRARIAEGATVEMLRAVIDIKTSQWLHDPKMNSYLRPATLFNAEKFAQYIGEIGTPSIAKQWAQKVGAQNFIDGEYEEVQAHAKH